MGNPWKILSKEYHNQTLCSNRVFLAAELIKKTAEGQRQKQGDSWSSER